MDDNGQPSETVAISRALLQQILDYLGTCPAGQVYPILRQLDEQLGPEPEQERPRYAPIPGGP